MASKPAPTKGKAAPPPPARKPAPAAPQRQVAPPQAEAEQQAKGTEVAVRRGSSMSTEFAKALVEGGHATGQGLSQAADDNLVPLAYILQKLSPQVESKKAEYIPGAKAGRSGSSRPAWSTRTRREQSEGIIVQPCHFSKWIMEWIPRDQGGGLVGATKWRWARPPSRRSSGTARSSTGCRPQEPQAQPPVTAGRPRAHRDARARVPGVPGQ
jgi:hypothetical protein